MYQRILLPMLLIAALFFAPGCWNQRDPELLAIVLGVAFDYDEDEETYRVIAQIGNPQDMPEEEEGAGSGRPFWVISASGRTPFLAMQNLGLISSREIFWAHNRVVLLSEAAARRGIEGIMDVSERERQTRLTARCAVVQGDIHKLMETDFPLEETGATGLDRQMVTVELDRSVFYYQFINEAVNVLESPGKELFLGRLEVPEAKTGAEDAPCQEDDNSENEPPPIAAGGAFFKGGKMAAWATPVQAKGWLLAMGRGERFSFALECPDNSSQYFSVEMFESEARRIPLLEGGRPQVIIKVKGIARLQNNPRPNMLTGGSKFIEDLEEMLSQTTKNRIEALIDRTRELETDALGLGNLFYRKHPSFWQENGERWAEILPGLPVDVQVEIELMRPGIVTEPITVR